MTSQARESRRFFRLGRLPKLQPLFPVGALTPGSLCGHREPIKRGSIFCCVICHTSGYDEHPDLQIEASTEGVPKPDCRELPPEEPRKCPVSRPETRRERRRRLFTSLAAANQIRLDRSGP